MKKIIFFFLLWIPQLLFSQTQTIHIIDGCGKAIQYANINLFDIKDSTKLYSTVSDSLGSFQLNGKKGIYRLSVKCLGYEDYNSTILIDTLKTIRLQEATFKLGEVVVHKSTLNRGNSLLINIENINPLANLVRVPSKEVALLSDFEVKRDRMAKEVISQNVTNISGVPSWMLSVLLRVMELSGKKHLQEVWPNLEVFFHGGISFTPYREQYEQLISKQDMQYMETYNASEGFFGIQDDPNDKSMSLMLDYGVYYEFLPMDEFESEKPNIVPLEGVEIGRNYAIIISTVCGLWRYEIGDTIQFTSVRPYKFVITGRTKYFINAFGEELIMDNAEKGIEAACKATGAQISDYTAAPIFMDSNAKCRHQWLIEFTKMPNSISDFERILDSKLQEINSDYEAKRFHDVTLQQLEVVVARKDLFNDWLKLKGKLGGQHKIPRLSNSRKNIDQMLAMNIN